MRAPHHANSHKRSRRRCSPEKVDRLQKCRRSRRAPYLSTEGRPPARDSGSAAKARRARDRTNRWLRRRRRLSKHGARDRRIHAFPRSRATGAEETRNHCHPRWTGAAASQLSAEDVGKIGGQAQRDQVAGEVLDGEPEILVTLLELPFA